MDVFKQVMLAREKIVEETKGQRNFSGMIVCPVCKDGRLSFAVHSNGHIHAQCDTENCVSWME